MLNVLYHVDTSRREFTFFLGCDSNSHNAIWGSRNYNKKRKSLFVLIVNNNLFICNIGTLPTFLNNSLDTIWNGKKFGKTGSRKDIRLEKINGLKGHFSVRRRLSRKVLAIVKPRKRENIKGISISRENQILCWLLKFKLLNFFTNLKNLRTLQKTFYNKIFKKILVPNSNPKQFFKRLN